MVVLIGLHYRTIISVYYKSLEKKNYKLFNNTTYYRLELIKEMKESKITAQQLF